MPNFDTGNWNKGKVSFFQALGLTGASYPQLGSTLAEGVAMNPLPGTLVDTSGGGSTPSSGSSGTGAINGCSAAETSANQALGKQLAATVGWGSGPSWDALNNLVMSESGWCNKAQNPSSTAYGIGQFLNETWATVGYARTSDPKTQILAMFKYIQKRYKTPQNAWTFHQNNRYY